MQAVTSLSLPARKFFIKDLQLAMPNKNITNMANLSVWDTSTLGLYPQFSMVWVQGTIANITKTGPEGDEFQLDDTTAKVRIVKPASLPFGSTALTEGRYVMVIGELRMAGISCVIKAHKIQDVPDEVVALGMWELEVKDMYLHCTQY